MQNKLVPVSFNDEESVAQPIVLFADRQTIASARVLRDSGEMIAPVTIARTGDMLYKAKELGPQFADLPPEQAVRVTTPPEVLFDEETINLCRSMAVTIGHPSSDVSLDNHKELRKGFLEGVPTPDGTHLSGFVVLTDKDAINLVDSGVDQTSWGHDALVERVEKNGVVSAIKTKITSVNHLAIVRRGRAQTTRIGDSGEEIEIVDRAQFEAVEAQRDELNVKVETLTAKLADAETARLTDEAIQTLVDERVKSRLVLLGQVAQLGDEFVKMDFSGKDEMAIKREVLTVLRDADMSEKSDDYVNVRFEIALEDGETVSLSDALSASLQSGDPKEEVKPTVRDEALARREARYSK